MKTKLKMMFCSLLGLAAIASVPASGAPLSPIQPSVPQAAAAEAPVIKAQDFGQRRWRDNRRIYPRHNRGWNRDWNRGQFYRGGPRWDRQGWDRPRWDRPGWRGPAIRHYRPHYRPYYRSYNRPYYRPYYRSGVQIIIGPGAYSPYYYAPRPVYRRTVVGGSHTRWCYARYKTYRAWDNTYVANRYGERRYCHSPYRR